MFIISNEDYFLLHGLCEKHVIRSITKLHIGLLCLSLIKSIHGNVYILNCKSLSWEPGHKNYTAYIHYWLIILHFLGILIDTALEYGWKVIPVPEVNKYGTPVLKSIFYTAMNYSSHSRFHGFCNGDILFTEGRGHLYFIHFSLPPPLHISPLPIQQWTTQLTVPSMDSLSVIYCL